MSHPAVAKTLPSERTEIDCCPECFVFTTFMGFEVGIVDVDAGRGCLAMMASAEEVRKYGAMPVNGDTESERTIAFHSLYKFNLLY